jgi:hypothetical protein
MFGYRDAQPHRSRSELARDGVAQASRLLSRAEVESLLNAERESMRRLGLPGTMIERLLARKS